MKKESQLPAAHARPSQSQSPVVAKDQHLQARPRPRPAPRLRQAAPQQVVVCSQNGQAGQAAAAGARAGGGGRAQLGGQRAREGVAVEPQQGELGEGSRGAPRGGYAAVEAVAAQIAVQQGQERWESKGSAAGVGRDSCRQKPGSNAGTATAAATNASAARLKRSQVLQRGQRPGAVAPVGRQRSCKRLILQVDGRARRQAGGQSGRQRACRSHCAPVAALQGSAGTSGSGD